MPARRVNPKAVKINHSYSVRELATCSSRVTGGGSRRATLSFNLSDKDKAVARAVRVKAAPTLEQVRRVLATVLSPRSWSGATAP